MRRHHHRPRYIRGHEREVLRPWHDRHLRRDRLRCVRVVARQHVYGDPGLLALQHAFLGLRPRRVVDPDQPPEDQALFEILALVGPGRVRVLSKVLPRQAVTQGLMREGQDPQTLRRQRFRVGSDLVMGGVSHGFDFAVVADNAFTGIPHAFDSPLLPASLASVADWGQGTRGLRDRRPFL